MTQLSASSDWVFYRPKFDYQEVIKNSFEVSAWIGHINFGYDLVANTRPGVVVELGTHWGVSFFSFCQAVKDHGIGSRLYAVDTWQGEEHAGLYGEKVLNTVRKITEKYFSSLKIELLRKTFDEARDDFKDQTIDLLHIDGLHTYETVKHDFENWLPKMKSGGVILFHDTSEKERDFGVYRLWEELATKYGQAVELPHCHGLGILLLDKQTKSDLTSLGNSWKAYYALMYEKDLVVDQTVKQKTLLSEKDKRIEELNILLEETGEAIAENMSIHRELNQTREHIGQLEHALNHISSSKFYRLWSGYKRLKSAVGGK